MGYPTVHVEEMEGTGPGAGVHFVRRSGLTMIGIGARRGSYEPRGPF